MSSSVKDFDDPISASTPISKSKNSFGAAFFFSTSDFSHSTISSISYHTIPHHTIPYLLPIFLALQRNWSNNIYLDLIIFCSCRKVNIYISVGALENNWNEHNRWFQIIVRSILPLVGVIKICAGRHPLNVILLIPLSSK